MDLHQELTSNAPHKLSAGSLWRLPKDLIQYSGPAGMRRNRWPASLPLIENDQGEPLSVGRTTRTISPALRRLLNARDKGCRFPGCTHTQFVDAHHIHHWANGGETKPSNLVTLCRHHHGCVHEGGFQIQVLDDGVLRFLRPDGRAVDCVAPGYTQPLSDWEYLPANNRKRGLSIDARTAATRWAGESMDYGLAVEVLMQRVARRRRATAVVEAAPTNWLPTTPGVGSTLERPVWMDRSWKVSEETREDDGVWWSSELAVADERVPSLADQEAAAYCWPHVSAGISRS